MSKGFRDFKRQITESDRVRHFENASVCKRKGKIRCYNVFAFGHEEPDLKHPTKSVKWLCGVLFYAKNVAIELQRQRLQKGIFKKYDIYIDKQNFT